MGDRHNSCLNPEICLCASDNHGVKIYTLKDGVVCDDHFAVPNNEPREYELAQDNAERLRDLLETGPGNNTPELVMIEIIKLLIQTKHSSKLCGNWFSMM